MQASAQQIFFSRNSLYASLIVIVLISIGMAIFGLHFLDSKWVLLSLLAFISPFVLLMIKNVRQTLLWLVVFTFPLNIDYNFIWTMSPSGSNFLGIRLTDILILILLGQLLLESFSEKQVGFFRVFPHISLPMLALITFCIISTAVAKNLLGSVIEIIDYLKILVFFFVLANAIRNKRDMNVALSGLFFGLVIQVIILTLQYYKGSTLGLSAFGLGENPEILEFQMRSENIPRPGGTIGLCNSVARYLGLLMPIAFTMMLVNRSRTTRWLAGVVTLTASIGLIYTLTRSAWIGITVSLLLIFPYLFIRRLATMRMIAQLAFAGIVMSILLIFYGHLLYGRIVSDDYGSARTRITTAKVALNVIRDHPFLGVGINNYGTVLEQYWDPQDRFTRRAAVHNTYLQYVAEIGIVGFIAYVWLIAAAFVRVRRAIRSRSDELATVAVGALGSYYFFVISALPAIANKNNFVVVLSFWVILALVEAINRISEEHEQAALDLLMSRKWMNEL